ncbi:MAG: hypothetical protein ACRDTR_05360 [Rubrobacter sp.]
MRPALTVLTPVLVPVLAALATSRPALAHGFGQTYDLPIPLWLYLFGAGAAVLVSFVPVSLLVEGGTQDPLRYPRFDLFRIGFLRSALNNRALLFCVRLLSVALLQLVIAAGLFGEQDAGLNIVPTFAWVLWWVGFSFFVAFVGNVWPLVNPWKILFEWAESLSRRLGANLQPGESYPKSWGVWPAVFLYAAFIWVENVFSGSATPVYIAVLAVNYSVLTWGGMVVYGKETWLRNGEVFSVFFDLLGRFAPTEVRIKNPRRCADCPGDCAAGEDGCVNCYECFAAAPKEERELCLRPPFVGLGRPEPVPAGGVFFVVLVLAGVAFDGLLETPVWVGLQVVTPLSRTLGLVVLPLVFFAVYLAFVGLSRLAGGGEEPLRRYAAAYVFSLVPIAVAYQVAHYYTLLLVQGQAIYRHISDPFGWGWDLFGTSDFTINAGIIGARFVWYSQVALIVIGHVVAVYLAHAFALRLFKDHRRAIWSQAPMLVLMVMYTVFSLWILSQPLAGT